jgi:hypothetical protein
MGLNVAIVSAVNLNNPKFHKWRKYNMTSRMTKTAKLVNFLAKNKEITGAQITKRFGLMNPSATIFKLREQLEHAGVKIYTNYSKKKGYRYRAYGL